MAYLSLSSIPCGNVPSSDPQDAMEMATMGSTHIASDYYQVKIGGDGAALTGIMKALVDLDHATPGGGILDQDFIRSHTRGFESLVAELAASSWDWIEAQTGLSRAALETVAGAYAKSNATIVSYGMGIVQHLNGTSNVQQIANLLLLRGNFGKPGAGICPLRGHSNVQGDRSVGISEKPSQGLLDGIEREFGFKPPQAHGHDAVAAMQAIAAGSSRVLISLGGNLAVALPDPARCLVAMRRLDLAVHIATKLNRSHLWLAKESIILPCLGRTELDVQATGPQSITVEDSMSMVHASRGELPPASPELRSEPAIVAGMAQATLPNSRIPWNDLIADYDRIRNAIEAVFPDFADFNQRIRHPGGFRLPLPPTERVWRTASGKAEFIPYRARHDTTVTNAAGTLLLATIRSHDQYNTTIYALGDRYRGVFGRRDVVFLNDQDLDDRGLEHGDMVDIISTWPDGTSARLSGVTAIAFDIALGSVAAYYPEANCLLPLSYHDRESGTPSYKSIPVRVVRSTPPALEGQMATPALSPS